jgi:hypothetical protein
MEEWVSDLLSKRFNGSMVTEVRNRQRSANYSRANTDRSWCIRYVTGQDETGSYIEYYAENRFVWGDIHERLYKDGRVVGDLPTFASFVVLRAGTDEDRARREQLEHNRVVASRLGEVGLR